MYNLGLVVKKTTLGHVMYLDNIFYLLTTLPLAGSGYTSGKTICAMLYRVEYLSGEEAGEVDLDETKLDDKSYVTEQVSSFAPKGMAIVFVRVIQKDKVMLIVPEDLPLEFKFPERQRWLTLSPCGKFVASGGRECYVNVWNLKTRECMRLGGHIGWVNFLTYSPCGKFVASGGCDCKVNVWNLQNHESITLEGHTDWVRRVAFSPCSKFVASGGYGGKIKVWNLKTQECMTLEGHTNPVNCVKFSPSGRMLQSVCGKEVKSWYLGPVIKIK